MIKNHFFAKCHTDVIPACAEMTHIIHTEDR
jgi:hypothetical protein